MKSENDFVRHGTSGAGATTVEPPVKQFPWTFYYHQGPAMKQAQVEARDEAVAMAVATRWCHFKGFRPPASVQPVIVATEAILKEKDPTVAEELPDPVMATTAAHVSR